MSKTQPMSAVDVAFWRARSGDHEGFADWVRLVELPLRTSLRRLARRVDVEAIVQEGLLRMWLLAPTLALDGEDASLRYALRLVQNLALREAERLRRFDPLDPAQLEHSPELVVAPDPPPDPSLRRAILDCISRLPQKPREALQARLAGRGVEPDRALAERLRMSLNTFLQNIVRARRHLARCLESRGIAQGEYSP